MIRILLFLSILSTGSAMLSLKKVAITDPARQPAFRLYPFLGKNGLYGYADTKLNLVILPQYKVAGFFDEHGYAAVQTSSNGWGVIGRDNKVILPLTNKDIRLFDLDDYTLVEVQNTSQANYLFWKWKFLPGLNLLGGGSNDKRLFDTHVRRINTRILVLERRNHKTFIRKLNSKSDPAGAYGDHLFKMITIPDNKVVLDGTLYQIRKSGIRTLARDISDLLDYSASHQQFAQRRRDRLRVIDKNGKPVYKTEFIRTDSLLVNVNGISSTIQLGRTTYERSAIAYTKKTGETFIYPDFSKALPKEIRFPESVDTGFAKAILQHPAVICSVPLTDYFLCMGYDNDQPGFLFFDHSGQGYSSIIYQGTFALTRPSGEIIWPSKDAIFPHMQLSERKRILRSSHLGEQYYQVSLENHTSSRENDDSGVDMGIWDVRNRCWLITPTYNYLKPLNGRYRFWAFRQENEGLWGIIDATRQKATLPKYIYMNESSMVTQTYKDSSITYYLDLDTMQEYYEK